MSHTIDLLGSAVGQRGGLTFARWATAWVKTADGCHWEGLGLCLWGGKGEMVYRKKTSWILSGLETDETDGDAGA